MKFYSRINKEGDHKFLFLHNFSLRSTEWWSAGYIPHRRTLRARVDAMNPQQSINQHLSNLISKTGEQNSKLAPAVVCLCLQLISMAAAAAVVQAVTPYTAKNERLSKL